MAEGAQRRGGGGDAPPIVIPLGLMLLALALLSPVFKRLKQSNIIACIIIGGGVGALKLHEEWQLSRSTMNAFIELGITLVLFMGGLEVDIGALRKYLKLTLINGCGQIFSHWALFMGIGALTGIVQGVVSIVVFGLVCTFSSTILVLGALKNRGDMESLHGQIILGMPCRVCDHCVALWPDS
jgi:CPA2 family monovalent cation:H+ antiporter-2